MQSADDANTYRCANCGAEGLSADADKTKLAPAESPAEGSAGPPDDPSELHDEPPAAVVPAGFPVDAAGVEYTTNPAAPGLKFFSCTAFRAILSQQGCGSRWRGAQTATGREAERYAACRGCPIGAAHAGERHVRYSRWYGVQICPRCDKGGLRMIRNRTCVSCYNRDRELKVGRNRRGNKPVEVMARAPRVHRMAVSIDGEVSLVSEPATSLKELMIQTLRTARGEVLFGRAPGYVLRRDGTTIPFEDWERQMAGEKGDDPGHDDGDRGGDVDPAVGT
jgi:hypothetical protein